MSTIETGASHVNSISSKTDYQTTPAERRAYNSYSFGQMMFYMIMTNFLQMFMTEIGVAAAAVGVILLVARVWDAVNDPMFGVIVSKSNLKSGKYLPWLRISSILIPIFTIALFFVPSSLSTTAKTIVAGVLYIAWGMSYTICDVPYFSVLTSMTTNTDERTQIISRSRLFTMVGALVVGLVVPMIYPAIGWGPAISIVSIVCFACMFPLGLGRVAQERHKVTGPAPTVRGLLKALVKNKYLLVFCIAYIIMNVTTANVVGYFTMYLLGDVKLMSVFALATSLPLVAFMAFLPVIIKKTGKYNLFMSCLVIGISTSVLMYFTGYSNLMGYMVIMIIRSVATSMASMLLSMFVLDCAEYGRYKSGEDMTALSVSIQTFSAKIYSAISGGFGMFVLSLAGFVSGDGAVQPPAVLDAIWFLTSWAPAIGLVLSFLILLFFYKLKDKDAQLMAKANSGEITREEAERLLSRQY